MYVSDITGRSYEGPDFLAMLEKRIRKHIRTLSLVEASKTYRFTECMSKQSAYLEHVLRQIFSDRITLSKTEGILLSTETLDDWVSVRVDRLFTGEQLQPTTYPTPLQVISTKELLVATELLKLEGTEPAATHQFVQELHAIYPQTKSSFLRSFLHIEEQLETFSKK
jgi:hypothetical protein